MRVAIISLLGLMITPLHAAPFDKGDPNAGMALHNKSCVTCHNSTIYTRPDRKTKSAAQLAARISGCNANTGAGWFPAEEEDVGAHLNQKFYHFK